MPRNIVLADVLYVLGGTLLGLILTVTTWRRKDFLMLVFVGLAYGAAIFLGFKTHRLGWDCSIGAGFGLVLEVTVGFLLALAPPEIGVVVVAAGFAMSMAILYWSF